VTPIPVAALDRALARKSFKEYLRQAWPLLEPARPMIPAWHLDAIAVHLQAVADGVIRRLIVCQPPGTGKSTTVGTAWPSWMWTHRPAWRLIGASHSHGLAVRDAMKHRDVVRSDWYERSFVRGAWKIRDDSDRKDDFANTAGGRRYATGVGSGTTGWRADAILIDDALAAQDAFSKQALETCWRWFTTTMTSRLDNPANAAIVVVGQRLATGDLPGRLMAEDGASWERLVLPSEYDRKRAHVTVLGWSDPRTEDAEPLFPQMHGQAVLAQAKKDQGSAQYAAQHLQNPIDEEGGMFPRKWWRFCKPDGVGDAAPRRPAGCFDGPAVPLPADLRYTIGVDLSFGANGDYTAIAVVGGSKSRPADRFVVEVIRRRMDFVAQIAALKDVASRYPGARIIVERAANGAAVISQLKSEVEGLIPDVPLGSKEARASLSTPAIEAGNVYLLEGTSWLDDVIVEHEAFPRGQFDDSVDALGLALRRAATPSGLERARAMGTW
jgi:predicted phage terminase large subunit-like protein